MAKNPFDPLVKDTGGAGQSLSNNLANKIDDPGGFRRRTITDVDGSALTYETRGGMPRTLREKKEEVVDNTYTPLLASPRYLDEFYNGDPSNRYTYAYTAPKNGPIKRIKKRVFKLGADGVEPIDRQPGNVSWFDTRIGEAQETTGVLSWWSFNPGRWGATPNMDRYIFPSNLTNWHQNPGNRLFINGKLLATLPQIDIDNNVYITGAALHVSGGQTYVRMAGYRSSVGIVFYEFLATDAADHDAWTRTVVGELAGLVRSDITPFNASGTMLSFLGIDEDVNHGAFEVAFGGTSASTLLLDNNSAVGDDRTCRQVVAVDYSEDTVNVFYCVRTSRYSGQDYYRSVTYHQTVGASILFEVPEFRWLHYEFDPGSETQSAHRTISTSFKNAETWVFAADPRISYLAVSECSSSSEYPAINGYYAARLRIVESLDGVQIAATERSFASAVPASGVLFSYWLTSDNTDQGSNLFPNIPLNADIVVPGDFYFTSSLLAMTPVANVSGNYAFTRRNGYDVILLSGVFLPQISADIGTAGGQKQYSFDAHIFGLTPITAVTDAEFLDENAGVAVCHHHIIEAGVVTTYDDTPAVEQDLPAEAPTRVREWLSSPIFIPKLKLER